MISTDLPNPRLSLFNREDYFLKNLLQKKNLHARWLNTLAFLEHIGSRKIIKSQNSYDLNLEVLQHIQEETSHAVFFKTLSLKVAPGLCPDFKEQHLLCGPASWNFFQSLDHFIEERVSKQNVPQNLCYNYTTWAIEQRAISLYRHYNQLLKEHHFDFHLNLILKQEDQHLKHTLSLIRRLDSKWNLVKTIEKFEERYYGVLLNKWIAELKI